MNPKLLAFLLFLAPAAQAIELTPQNIYGHANYLHAEFLISWSPITPSNHPSAVTSGSWAGGSFNFSFTASDTIDGSYGVPEGQFSFNLQTTWLDGWLPGGLGGFKDFTWGYPGGNTGSLNHSLFFPRYPSIIHDWSGQNLRYFLDLHSFIQLQTGLDTSGTARLSFDLVRTSAVPEHGGFLLLPLSLIAIALFRNVTANRNDQQLAKDRPRNRFQGRMPHTSQQPEPNRN